jgi:N-acetylmuramate 1-kinase
LNTKQIVERAFSLITSNNATDKSLRWKKLAGDASLRKYYRVEENNSSYVLMLAEPFKAVSYDFLLVQSFLQDRDVPVPNVIAVEESIGAILLEDLSDQTLLHELGQYPEKEEDLLKTSIQLLLKFHENTKQGDAPPPVPGFQLAFDEEKLVWEVDFTLEHLFQSYLKRTPPERDLAILREGFVDICRRLAAEPRVFTHRDYHSRNIMLSPGRGQVCIDFQDARMGLRAYDLASLLRDSYYQLSEDRIYALVQFYWQGIASNPTNQTFDHFIRTFDLMSIQRNFKAIGSFTSFYGKRNEAGYLRFVGNTFENIRRNLHKFPEYESVRETLFRLYYF